MIAIQTSRRNGRLVAACLVQPGDEIILISQNGVLIRTSVDDIREMGRSTQGVTLMALDDGDRLVTVVKVARTPVVGDEDEGEGDAGV
jgi:DNA gyrase subunit A